MTPGIKPLVAGNWKMNGLKENLSEITAMAQGYGRDLAEKTDLLVCVPATLISQAVQSTPSIAIGAQDCHPTASGAHTGDISTAMIADCGAGAVIVGHSERRTDHGESDELVCAKASAGLGQGLQTIICIGETGDERKSGKTLDVLKRQMDGSIPADWTVQNAEMIIAYEPVWAIGTGLTPTPKDVEEAHGFMREQLVEKFGEKGKAVRLLYGGSVKPSNAAELMAIANVDGALVGGASLKAADFMGIAAAYSSLR